MIVRTISASLVHGADAVAKGDIASVERAHLFALVLQGLRIANHDVFKFSDGI